MKSWPHAPCHLINEAGTYMVTGATLKKEKFFTQEHELDLINDTLLELAEHYNWRLEAWAIFSNHYHFIAHTSNSPTLLEKFMKHLHANTARKLNNSQGKSGRSVWYQYWDTKLTFNESYMARLNYVMQNPVRHGLVEEPKDYRWCSAAWFERTEKNSYYNTVRSMKIDSVNVYDDF
ncbi:MAG TPA: transposase [Parachlamydiaceae bacterium]|nr:transposase [Parachlamydiaceae bacterium]